MQPEIETEGILDEGTKREQRVMDSVRVYAGVYAMRGCMCRRVGAMRKCGLCRYGTLCNVRCAGTMRYAGRAGGTECMYGQYTMQICAM